MHHIFDDKRHCSQCGSTNWKSIHEKTQFSETEKIVCQNCGHEHVVKGSHKLPYRDGDEAGQAYTYHADHSVSF